MARFGNNAKIVSDDSGVEDCVLARIPRVSDGATHVAPLVRRTVTFRALHLFNLTRLSAQNVGQHLSQVRHIHNHIGCL